MTACVHPIPPHQVPDILDDLARLRIEVFAEFPYLHDRDLGYERNYLRAYEKSLGAMVVSAYDGETLAGAATGTPMEDHAQLAEALRTESALLPEHRGYQKVPGAVAMFSWKDIGDTSETEKPLQLWFRRLEEDAP